MGNSFRKMPWKPKLLQKIKKSDDPEQVKEYVNLLKLHRQDMKALLKSKSLDQSELEKSMEALKEELIKKFSKELTTDKKEETANVFAHIAAFLFSILFFGLGTVGLLRGPYWLNDWLIVIVFFLATLICLFLVVGPNFIKRMREVSRK